MITSLGGDNKVCIAIDCPIISAYYGGRGECALSWVPLAGRGLKVVLDGVMRNRMVQEREKVRQKYTAELDDLYSRYPGPKRQQVAVTATATDRAEVSVGCLPCARAHLATVAGTLKEALRFARGEEEGILHPEVQTRLQTAEEDITVIERHDWTPEKILASPEQEQAVIRDVLPELRELRQDIIQITTVEDLERAAVRAARLSDRLRAEVLRLRGINVQRVKELAQKVDAGEMTMEDAKKELAAMTGGQFGG